jgi:hypothetical protein
MLVSLPGIECTACGAIGLDRERVSTMPPEAVPAAIRGRDTTPPDSSAVTERPAPVAAPSRPLLAAVHDSSSSSK